MRLFSLLYTLLLVYIVAALVFWGFSLVKQSQIIFEKEVVILQDHIDSAATPQLFQKTKMDLEEKENKRRYQYFGEGTTFLAIILIGAGIVYSSIRSNHQLATQQKNFMLSITHELKSPLAAIKLNLQTLGRHNLADDKKLLLLERSLSETDRLNDLCSNLLIASQMETHDYKSTEEHIELSGLVARVVADSSQRNTKHQFESDIAPDCYVSGDKLLLQLMVSNLVENAVKYAPAGTLIKTKLTTNDEHISLTIADNGIGISNEEKPKIFKKFYRVGSEDTRKTKGTGLGLYITERIVKNHNGTITVRDNEPSGTIFEINLPC